MIATLGMPPFKHLITLPTSWSMVVVTLISHPIACPALSKSKSTLPFGMGFSMVALNPSSSASRFKRCWMAWCCAPPIPILGDVPGFVLSGATAGDGGIGAAGVSIGLGIEGPANSTCTGGMDSGIPDSGCGLDTVFWGTGGLGVSIVTEAICASSPEAFDFGLGFFGRNR